MLTVRQLLEQKSATLWSIHPEASVFDAIASMAEKNIGSLLVLDGGRLVGIVTERHYARNVVLKGKSSPTTAVRDIMDTHVLVVRPEQTVEHCMALMSEKRVRHLPVIDEGQLIGIISIGDLMKSIIGEQQHIIEQLEHYIRS